MWVLSQLTQDPATFRFVIFGSSHALNPPTATNEVDHKIVLKHIYFSELEAIAYLKESLLALPLFKTTIDTHLVTDDDAKKKQQNDSINLIFERIKKETDFNPLELGVLVDHMRNLEKKYEI